MRFSLFPHLFQCIFCIWIPNMTSLSRPILYFHHSVVKGVLEILHTHLGILFQKVFPMFTIQYPVSYSLGRIFL
jgi:hypothetical protein